MIKIILIVFLNYLNQNVYLKTIKIFFTYIYNTINKYNYKWNQFKYKITRIFSSQKNIKK